MKREPKYKYVTNNNKVIAISSFGGKTVRGVAVCDEKDEFDEEVGKKLAKLRCDKKASIKKVKHSRRWYYSVLAKLSADKDEFEKAAKYYTQAAQELREATKALYDFEESLR